jgi:hypothetical protein
LVFLYVGVFLYLSTTSWGHVGRGRGCVTSLFLTSTKDESEWSASRHSRFTPGERTPGTHWLGGWVGLSSWTL